MKTSTPRRSSAQVLILTLFFFCSSAGGWAWFHVNPRDFPVYYHFNPRTNLVDYEFIAEPVSEEAMEILATTNLLNGNFIRRNENRYTIFVGEWNATDVKGLSVVGHTPDVCWVSAGAKPVELGQPEIVELDFDGVKIPFECRVFRMRDDLPPEMVMWCALASGQVYYEGGRFTGNSANKLETLNNIAKANRTRSINSFISSVSQRIAADGTKQFLRFSAPVGSDWRINLVQLKEFARRWLRLEIKRSPGKV